MTLDTRPTNHRRQLKARGATVEERGLLDDLAGELTHLQADIARREDEANNLRPGLPAQRDEVAR